MLGRSRTLAPVAAGVAGLAAAATLTVAPAGAAVTCDLDPWETDTPSTGSPITVGTVVHRAICQYPTPQPRSVDPRDRDYLTFTAPGGVAYHAEAVDLGSALVNDVFDRGGIDIGVGRLNDDGTVSSMETVRSLNGDHVTTAVLPAGRYVVVAMTNNTQVYPDNTMDIATVEGDAGRYGIKLTQSAPAPQVASIKLGSTTVNGGKSTTLTVRMDRPAPPGGQYVDVKSSNLFIAYPNGDSGLAPGASSFTIPILTKRPSTDTRVTLTVWGRVGPSMSTVLTVRR